jgi:hypothetical protein
MNLKIKNIFVNQEQETLKEKGNSSPDSLGNIWRVFLHIILKSIIPGEGGS